MDNDSVEKQLKIVTELLELQKKLTNIHRLRSQEVGKVDELQPDINALSFRLYNQKKEYEEIKD